MRLILFALGAFPTVLIAQGSGLPSPMPPVRSSGLYEFAMLVAFPDGASWGSELAYWFPVGSFDLAGRVAVVDPDGPADGQVLGEVQSRLTVSRPTRDFPVHTAVSVSVGTCVVNGSRNVGGSVGYHIGRSFPLAADASLVPYAGPVLLVRSSSAPRAAFLFGVGGDLQLGPRFTTRLGVSLGDVEGVTLGVVWRQ